MILRPPRSTLFSLHDALPIYPERIHRSKPTPRGRNQWEVRDWRAFAAATRTGVQARLLPFAGEDRKSTRLNSSHANISYVVLFLKTNIENTFSRLFPDTYLQC